MPDRVEIIPCQQSPALLGKWRDCVRSSTNIRAWMQTPEWLDFKWRPFTQAYIATLNDEQTGNILAITPLVRTNYALKFSIRGTELATISLNSLLLIGSDPLFPASEQNYHALCRAVLSVPSIDCFYMSDVPTSSQFWAFLEKAQKTNPDWLFYVPEFAVGRYYYIDTSISHQQYLAQFKPKTLQEYRRKFRLLEKELGVKLELMRIRTADEVISFLDAAQAIAKRSWQGLLIGIAVDKQADRREFLESMARRGLLRSYLLRAGENVIAFEIGFQANGTLCFLETAFDPAYARFSPGQTLFNLVVKDCFEVDRPNAIYYGPGEMTYKKMLANRHGEEITILILRKTVGNHAKVTGHRLFRKGIAIIKTCLGLRRRG